MLQIDWKDKNGRSLKEGDMIRYFHINEKFIDYGVYEYEMEWVAEKFELKLRNDGVRLPSNSYSIYLLKINRLQQEVNDFLGTDNLSITELVNMLSGFEIIDSENNI
jgi:hypothetical protein